MPKPNEVPLSPISFLNRAADIYPEKTAIVAGSGASVPYRELRSRAVRLANALQAEDVQASGSVVAILAPNDLHLLEAHFGAPAAKASLVALNVRLASAEYATILRHCRAKVLIVDRSLVERVTPIIDELPDLKLLVEIGDDCPSVGFRDYEEWIAAEDDTGSLELPASESDPITINYTSGTTGAPKGAVYTHRGAYLNALGQAIELGLAPESVYLWTLPMFHCNGWCFTWAVTALGATHIALRKFDGGGALRLIQEQGVTHFCGAPVVLSEIAQYASRAGAALPHRVRAATGGAPPSPTVLAAMESLGVDVLHLYGLTETYGPSIACERQPAWDGFSIRELADAMSRQGVRTVNVESVRVVDDRMEDVKPGSEMGEIVIRSNTVFDRYLDAPDETERAFRGGWFHTGDLAVVHPDGYVEVRDRAKDVIISGGENVSSIEVESALLSHPDVLEAAVVAQPHSKWGEVPVAFVAIREDGSEIEEAELIEWVRARLAHFKAPKTVAFCQLPRTSTGKIRKTELRRVAQRQVAESDVKTSGLDGERSERDGS